MEHIMESFMSIPDAALRGGAAAILLLLAALLLRDAGRTPAGRNLALYFLSAAGYAVCSAPGLARLDNPLAIALLIVSLGAPALFWMSAAAVFNDGFRPKWYPGFAWIGLVALGLWSMFDPRPFAGFAYYALSLLFVGLAAWHALAGWESDFLEGRRRLRILVAVATAVYAGAIIIVDVLSPGSSVSARFSIFNAAGLVAMTFAGAMAWMGLVRRAPVAPSGGDARSSTRAQAGDAAPPAQPDGGPEMALLVALRRLMD